MTDAERRQALEAIAAEISVCSRCRLHEARTRAVPGEGSPDTEVVFVGEAPGFNEDRQGRPFVGQAGGLLGELLEAVGWQRQDVFITNVVKCRPPGNRDPEPDEIAACAPFLTRQLEVLDPALVVTLGRFSMSRFSPGARIGQVHGTYRPADPSSGAPGALCFAMYHPAAALHQGSLKQTLFADMQGVPRALLDARDLREAAAGGRTQAAAPGEAVVAPGEAVASGTPDDARPAIAAADALSESPAAASDEARPDAPASPPPANGADGASDSPQPLGQAEGAPGDAPSVQEPASLAQLTLF